MPWTDPETSVQADSFIAQFGPADTPEALEKLANETVRDAEAFEDGPEVARMIAAELRRRALILRNGG